MIATKWVRGKDKRAPTSTHYRYGNGNHAVTITIVFQVHNCSVNVIQTLLPRWTPLHQWQKKSMTLPSFRLWKSSGEIISHGSKNKDTCFDRDSCLVGHLPGSLNTKPATGCMKIVWHTRLTVFLLYFTFHSSYTLRSLHPCSMMLHEYPMAHKSCSR